MATKKVIIFGYRGYRHLSEDEALKMREQRQFTQKMFEDINQTPDVIREMFAPDPATGNPASDFYIRSQSDSDIRDYIDKYMMSIVTDSPRTSDVDLALDSTKTRFENNDEYFKRLQSLVNKDVK